MSLKEKRDHWVEMAKERQMGRGVRRHGERSERERERSWRGRIWRGGENVNLGKAVWREKSSFSL